MGNPRAAVYFDGFNLFHALDELGEPHLKWLNLWDLSVRLVGRYQSLTRVVWCSAEHPDEEKAERWRAYRDALKAVGVVVAEGHFGREPFGEKEGDVNVALHLMMDAYEDVFDVAYMVTADSDQAATARLFKEKFGKASKPKRFVTVAPPGRRHGKHILEHADTHKLIRKDLIETCLFPASVADGRGGTIVRPPRYTPPQGWVPELQRKQALLDAAAANASAKS